MPNTLALNAVFSNIKNQFVKPTFRSISGVGYFDNQDAASNYNTRFYDVGSNTQVTDVSRYLEIDLSKNRKFKAGDVIQLLSVQDPTKDQTSLQYTDSPNSQIFIATSGQVKIESITPVLVPGTTDFYDTTVKFSISKAVMIPRFLANKTTTGTFTINGTGETKTQFPIDQIPTSQGK